jgi:hypothetical protein
MGVSMVKWMSSLQVQFSFGRSGAEAVVAEDQKGLYWNW